MKTILCDVDDVVAGFHQEWARRIGEGLGIKLSPSVFTCWDLRKVFDAGTVAFAYSLLRDPNFYDRVVATPGACWGVERLRAAGHRVVFVTASTDVSAGQKMRWLAVRGLTEDPESRDLIVAKDKSLIRGDLLIDDGPHNTEVFSGPSILVDMPHNRSTLHPHRVTSWVEIPEMVERIFSGSL